MVDESQVLCKDEFAASELLYAVETYRKCGGIITFLFQNLKHALENSRLRDMLSNCSCKIFFDQGGVDAEALAKIQELSKEEYLALNESQPGYGLLVWDTQVYLLDAVMDSENELFPYIDTNFHEKAKAKNEKEREEKGFVLKDRVVSLISISPMDKQTICDMCASTNTQKQVEETIRQLVMENTIVEKQEKYYLTEDTSKKKQKKRYLWKG